MTAPDLAQVRDDAEHGRFLLDFEGGQAFASYRPLGDDLLVTHTEVPPAFEGRGIGSALVEGLARIARDNGRKIVPGCGFVAAWARSHPDWSDVFVRP